MTDIICSAGKGTMETGECLACSLKHQGGPCGYDYSLLLAMFKHDESTQRATEVHVTDVVGCLRRAWYSKMNPSAEYVHEGLAKWIGISAHSSIEVTADPFFVSELPLNFGGMVGKADIYYKDGRVVDTKSTRWLYVDKVPYGSHALQVNIYGYMLRKMGKPVSKLQIQYIDASGPTKCRKCKVPVRWFEGELRCPVCMKEFPNGHMGALLVEVPVMTDGEVEYYITERKEELEASMLTGLPPEPEPSYLCDYCSSRDICLPKEVTE
jgi:CRISPR/Cas system-associated exonuclease Cas4 (RecB family)